MSHPKRNCCKIAIALIDLDGMKEAADALRESLLPGQILGTFTIAFGKGGQPCFPVLRAQALSAFFFAFPAPLRNVNVKYRLPETIAVQGTFYFGSNFFL